MRSFFALAIVVTLVYSCAPKSGPAPVAASNSTTTPAATPATAPAVTPATAPVVTKTESSAVMAGRETFTAKCGRCHGLKNPTDFTATQWITLVNNMAPKARLDETEKANVLAFVQANAKP